MQTSIKWLKDYIDFDLSADELADLYTMAGVPVENIVRQDEGFEKVITGRVEEIAPNPNSDHLQICQMNVGEAELITIQTGAANVRQGDIVPVAMVGAHLPNGVKISKGKMRGVVSNGMLCSAGELMLPLEGLPEEQQNGILILPPDTPVGVPAAEVFGLDDAVLEFELTANRADCFSVWGLVREAAVLTGSTPHFPEITVNEDDPAKAADMVSIAIEDAKLCHRFSARVIRNVKIAPSPAWMQNRLAAAGIRAINNVVDVTNFVMVELGQPMHAYDYDRVAGHRLTARPAIAGEELHTLDDTSRKARGGEIVIADAEKAAGLGGVMGGFETEVTDATTTIVLEAASFDGASIRRASRGIGLHSEASGRFERGIDRTETVRALNRAVQLLQDMGACTVTQGVVDVYPAPAEPRKVSFTTEAINSRLGTEIADARMESILTSLGFRIEKKDDGRYEADVPSWRSDVTIMDDLSEEVARIYGFDNIPSTLPRGDAMQGIQSEKANLVDAIHLILQGMGMMETVSFAFTHPSMFDKLQMPADSPLRQAVPIMNPLTDEYPLLRTTLLTSILENAARNFSRKNDNLHLFEIANVFTPKALPVTEQPVETTMLAGLLTGRRHGASWNQIRDGVDFYDAKGIVEELLRVLRIKKYTVEAGEHYAMHPGKTALFKKGREVIATVGELHPAVSDAMRFTQPVYVFEMSVETLKKYQSVLFKSESLPKYPAISRDLALIVDKDAVAADILRAIEKKGGKDFRKVELFDVYEGKQVAENKKSMAIRIDFQSADRTLTDEEVDAVVADIVKALQSLGAELRA
ncbi:phenylalanine--tRNA ligase subunit beta [Selenomonas sp. TAMA-11512]|uniref:phenylalanine--tRNA ligase subunit beta n=1 Tax=Selenomonas sp. TAMA-11512 TaxID=3095337 RepID=UPI00309025AB|nr:phenylalanine--tRNA ligase subunit beta [Selenomonas sp. TAMA-11512]